MTGDDTHAWQLERSMTPHQFQRAIDYLGMSQAGPGRFLGVSERTAYRYASGNAKIPTAAALLLRAMVDPSMTGSGPGCAASAATASGPW